MKVWTRIALAAMLMLTAGLASAITGEKSEFRKLADDVYAYVGKLNDANAMAIVTKQGVVIVDTGNNQPETRNFAKQIAAVTSQPIRYVVITQNHGDHIGGSPFFAPPATMVVHDKVAADVKAMKPFQIRSWCKRFPERTEALKDVVPSDVVMSFPDRMTLDLGGKHIELIYIDDKYNIGDVAVWLPDSGVLHAAFAGYKDRHPDIRPDYSHGTTWGMLKQLEALIALQPKIVVPAHGPVGDVKDLQAMVDYLVIARQKVRTMMDKGMSLDAMKKQFEMNEYKGWDRTQHLPMLVETLDRELRGMGPQISKYVEHDIKGVIGEIAEEGRYLKVKSEKGDDIRLRVTSATNIEGVADRTQLRAGMKFEAIYQEPEGYNAALGFDIDEITATP